MASRVARCGSACGPRSSAGWLAALFLILVTGPLAAIALAFGPWEYFSLFVLAMAMVAGLAEASLVKGLLSTAIGLLITVIGTDPIGAVPRFTFGSDFIGGGFAVPARADRHLRLRADHDRHREDAAAGSAGRGGGKAPEPVGGALEGDRRDPGAAVPVPVVGDRRHPHRRAAGDRRQRGQRAGLRPGQEVLQDARAVRHRPSRGHHRLGGFQQRQRRRLAGDHHGVRHSGRRGHSRDAGRHDHPRHPVGPAVRVAEPRPRLRHLRGLHPGPSADGDDHLGQHASSCYGSPPCASPCWRRSCWCCA